MAEAARVAVVEIGMVSPLGANAAATCAASRAGLSRLAETEYMVEDKETLEMIPVAGHSAAFLTRGFGELGRLVRLASLALQDLLQRSPGLRETIRETSLTINIASDFYLRTAAETIAERRPGEGRTPVAAPPWYRRASKWYREQLPGRLLRVLGLEEPPRSLEVSDGDHSGFADALVSATGRLVSGSAECCIVGGVDSLLEPIVLDALHALGVLKTRSRPNGIVPGEASAFLALKTRDRAIKDGDRILGEIRSVMTSREENHRFEDRPPLGVALHRAIASLPVQDAPPVARVFIDLNGDVYRARDWGHALVRLGEGAARWESQAPAEAVGDTGAAAGFVAMCLAIHAIGRSRDPSSAIVWAASDDGRRGAALIGSARN